MDCRKSLVAKSDNKCYKLTDTLIIHTAKVPDTTSFWRMANKQSQKKKKQVHCLTKSSFNGKTLKTNIINDCILNRGKN